MPLGDPGGCNFQYTTEGLPENIVYVEIPVADMERAVRFYKDVLGLDVISQNNETSILSSGSQKMILSLRPKAVGKDTGIFFGVDAPFNFNRRMVDDGVVMIRHPRKGDIGVYASFLDSEGNILHVI